MECDNVIAIKIAPALKITYQRNASAEQEAHLAAMLKLFFCFVVCTTPYPISSWPI